MRKAEKKATAKTEKKTASKVKVQDVKKVLVKKTPNNTPVKKSSLRRRRK